jgi:hypothetical protein
MEDAVVWCAAVIIVTDLFAAGAVAVLNWRER